jgi:hypothetical protein
MNGRLNVEVLAIVRTERSHSVGRAGRVLSGGWEELFAGSGFESDGEFAMSGIAPPSSGAPGL